ncbi:MAG: hypothetical protein VYA34_00075 [Myxococcota bacterium]|nr:hypothetical protein [Myxococcota bacterium]
MAGGKYADSVACFECGERAKRIAEGREDDRYRCIEGHEFSIHWGRNGEPEEPQWPPSSEVQRLITKIKEVRTGL